MVSKKPGKQRLKGSESPIHLKRKRIRARLVTDDPELQSIRSVTVLSLIHISEPTRPY